MKFSDLEIGDLFILRKDLDDLESSVELLVKTVGEEELHVGLRLCENLGEEMDEDEPVVKILH